MAVPVPTATTSSQQAAQTTSHTVALPDTLIAGEVAVCHFAPLGGAAQIVSFPEGWVILGQGGLGGGSGVYGVIAVKLLTEDDEALESITVLTNSSVESAHYVEVGPYDIEGIVTQSAPITANSNTQSYPTVNVPAGDYRVLACASLSATSTIQVPANYTQLVAQNTGGGNAVTQTVSYRELIGITSETPANTTSGAAERWATFTVAIPAAAEEPVGGDIDGEVQLGFTSDPALTGMGAVGGTVGMSLTPLPDVTGLGRVSAGIESTFSTTPTVVGEGAVAAQVPLTLAPMGTMLGVGDLAGEVATQFILSPEPRGMGALGALTELRTLVEAILEGGGVGELVAEVPVTLTASGALTGEGALAMSLPLTLGVTPGLSGSGDGTLTSELLLTMSLQGALNGQGDLSAVGLTSFLTAAQLRGGGELASEVALIVALSAGLNAHGALDAVGQLVLTVTPEPQVGGGLAARPTLILTMDPLLGGLARLEAAGDLAFTVAADPAVEGEVAAATDLTFRVDSDLTAPGELDALVGILTEILGSLGTAGPEDFLTITLMGRTRTIVLTASPSPRPITLVGARN